MPGAHNAENALVALRTATLLGVDAAAAAAALADFPGIARRLEFAGRSAAGAHIFDDYGHHPTEVRSALHAARELATGRLVAVFQPHLFSRTAHFAQDFADALALADLVLVCDVYPAREQAEDWPGVSARLIVDAIEAGGRAAVRWTPTLNDAAGRTGARAGRRRSVHHRRGRRCRDARCAAHRARSGSRRLSRCSLRAS